MIKRRSPRFNEETTTVASEIKSRSEIIVSSDLRGLSQAVPVFDLQTITHGVQKQPLESTPPRLHGGASEVQVISTASNGLSSTLDISNLSFYGNSAIAYTAPPGGVQTGYSAYGSTVTSVHNILGLTWGYHAHSLVSANVIDDSYSVYAGVAMYCLLTSWSGSIGLGVTGRSNLTYNISQYSLTTEKMQQLGVQLNTPFILRCVIRRRPGFPNNHLMTVYVNETHVVNVALARSGAGYSTLPYFKLVAPPSLRARDIARGVWSKDTEAQGLNIFKGAHHQKVEKVLNISSFTGIATSRNFRTTQGLQVDYKTSNHEPYQFGASKIRLTFNYRTREYLEYVRWRVTLQALGFTQPVAIMNALRLSSPPADCDSTHEADVTLDLGSQLSQTQLNNVVLRLTVSKDQI